MGLQDVNTTAVAPRFACLPRNIPVKFSRANKLYLGRDWNGRLGYFATGNNSYKAAICGNLYLQPRPMQASCRERENTEENNRVTRGRRRRGPSGEAKNALFIGQAHLACATGSGPCMHISRHVPDGYPNVHARTFLAEPGYPVG